MRECGDGQSARRPPVAHLASHSPLFGNTVGGGAFLPISRDGAAFVEVAMIPAQSLRRCRVHRTRTLRTRPVPWHASQRDRALASLTFEDDPAAAAAWTDQKQLRSTQSPLAPFMTVSADAQPCVAVICTLGKRAVRHPTSSSCDREHGRRSNRSRPSQGPANIWASISSKQAAMWWEP